jgi:tetratricopeptide (TPR) repeat protein
MKDIHSLSGRLAAQDWPAAERVLRRMAKGKSPPPDVFYNLAKVLEAAGKPDQMMHWLERAVAANPRYGIAWFELGRAAVKSGALAQAQKAFQHAVDLMPTDADARRNLGRIALRRGDWASAETCFATLPDLEAQIAIYRLKAETGQATKSMRDALLAQLAARPQVLKALTRTAKGTLPLTLTQPETPNPA